MHAKYTKNEEGVVMMFALLVLTVMVTIGFVLSSLMYREIRLSRSFTDSFAAYYAAESGVEQGLDFTTHYRNQDGVLEDAVSATPDVMTVLKNTASTTSPITLPSSRATYFFDATQTTSNVQATDFPLYKNKPKQIELYDPDDFLTTSNAQSMRIQWTTSSTCPVNPRVEVTLEVFNQGNVGTQLGINNNLVHKEIHGCLPSADTNYACQAVSNTINPARNYVVRVHALDCDLPTVHTVFYDQADAAGNVISIPSVVHIAAHGKARSSEFIITSTSKWVPSASGLADFVLFAISQIN